MIIVCSGPDTYRAREKARELVAAFREKHDAGGFSTEHLDASAGIEALTSRLGTVSLFAAKRCLRMDRCLEKVPISAVRSLADRLEADKDLTIVITVEEIPPTQKVLDALKKAPLYHYPFPIQDDASFKAWVRKQAERMGVEQKIADVLAQKGQGDSWWVMQEMAKQAANPNPENIIAPQFEDDDVFRVSEAVLRGSSGWRADAYGFEDSLFHSLLSQTRSFVRVRDGQIDGLHPYVVKKMKMLGVKDVEKKFLSTLKSFVSARNGLATDEEAKTLL